MKEPRERSLVLSTPIIGVFATDIESGRHYDRHWHTTFGFGLMVRGAHRSLSGRGVVDARAGDVITTNPGEVHDGRPLDGASRRWRMAYVEPEVMSALASDDQSSSDMRLAQPVFRDNELVTFLGELFRCLDEGMAVSDRAVDLALACEEALLQVIGRLVRDHSTWSPRRTPAADMSLVQTRLADLSDPPTLGELARMAGLSRYQLLRRFERQYGLTPFRWQRQLRLERARQVIARGAGLATAAAECGFADQSHMTRLFVRQFGFSPAIWAAGSRKPRPES